jgi:stage V sporulation protein B
MLRGARDVSYMFLGQVISIIVGLVITIFIARMLGPSGYGTFQLVFSMASLVFSVVALNIESAVVYFVSKEKNKAKILGTALQARLLFVLVGYLLIFLLSDSLESIYLIEGFSIYMRVMGLDIIFSGLFTLFLSYLSGISKFDQNAGLNVLYNVLRGIIIVPMTFAFGIAGAVTGKVLDSIIITILVLFMLRSHIRVFFDKKILKKMLQYSFPPYVSTFFYMSMVYFPILLLGWEGNEVVGYFSAAFLILSSLEAMSRSFSDVGIQRTSSKRTSREKKDVCRNLERYLFLFASFSAFAIMPFSSQIITIIYGPDYSPAVLALQIMVLGFLINSLVSPLGVFAYGSEKTGVIRDNTIIQALFTFTVGYFLISSFGLFGAALTILYRALLGLLFMYFTFGKKNKIRFNLSVISKSFIAGFSMYLVIASINSIFDFLPSILLGSSLGLLTFFLALVLLRFFNKQDIMIIEDYGKLFGIDLKRFKPFIWFKKMLVESR